MTEYRMTIDPDGHVFISFGDHSFSTRQVETLQTEVDRLTAERDAWCLACPSGCHECAGRDCECYEHQDLHPEHLKTEVEQLRAAIQRVRAMRYRPRRTCNDWVSGHDTGYNNAIGDVYKALDGREGRPR